jgi:hypothetical protein
VGASIGLTEHRSRIEGVEFLALALILESAPVKAPTAG